MRVPDAMRMTARSQASGNKGAFFARTNRDARSLIFLLQDTAVVPLGVLPEHNLGLYALRVVCALRARTAVHLACFSATRDIGNLRRAPATFYSVRYKDASCVVEIGNKSNFDVISC
ncbi:uncharacterized protein LOC144109559 [Amblyomma americanum]